MAQETPEVEKLRQEAAKEAERREQERKKEEIKDAITSIMRCAEPSPVTSFTGQEHYLKQLERKFLPREDLPVLVLTGICGLGGIGKTSLATQFFYHSRQFSFKWWFPADTAEQLYTCYFDMVKKLVEKSGASSLPKSEDEIIGVLKNWLENPENGGWLLVYDNAKDYEALEKYLPHRNGYVLVTSRNLSSWPNWDERQRWGENIIEMDVMTEEDAINLICKLIINDNPDKKDKEICSLVNTLGRLPLALAQAGAYIKNNLCNGMTPAKYREKYCSQTATMLKYEKLPPGSRHIPVYVTWDISMEQIATQVPDAQKILIICAYLHADNIPRVLLEKYLEKGGSHNAIEDLNKIVSTLVDYSMIKTIRGSISIHRVIQDVLRNKQAEDNAHLLWLEGIIDSIQAIYPMEKSKAEDHDFCRHLIPHMESVQGHIKKITSLNEEKRADLLECLGDAYKFSLGYPMKAIDYFEKALSMRLRIYGEMHSNLIISYDHLANTYRALGKFHQAIKHYEKVLEIRLKHYGEEHPDVATTYTDLGLAMASLGKYEEARKCHEKVLAIRLKAYKGKEPHPDIASSYSCLGETLRSLGRYKEAKKHHEKALAIRRTARGEEHPHTAISYSCLGLALKSLGRYEEAKEHHEKALAIREKTYNENHPHVVVSYNCLGSALESLSDYENARKYHKKALKFNKEAYGEQHTDVAETYKKLGNVYASLGNYTKAINCYEQALTINLEVYDENHPYVAIIYNKLGHVWTSLGNYTKAINCYEQALAINLKIYDENHLYVAVINGNLGEIYNILGQPGKTIELLRKAFSIFEMVYDENHSYKATALKILGIAHGLLGNKSQQKEKLIQALCICKTCYSENHIEVAKILTALGDAYITESSEEDTRQAVKYLQNAQEISKKHYGENHIEVAKIETILGYAYMILGNLEQAHALVDHALKIKQTFYINQKQIEIGLTLFYCAQVYFRLGKIPSALQYAQQAYDKHVQCEQDFDGEHIRIKSIKEFITRCQTAQKEQISQEPTCRVIPSI
jgi:tetratricopeptide (TPR) repeat protein